MQPPLCWELQIPSPPTHLCIQGSQLSLQSGDVLQLTMQSSARVQAGGELDGLQEGALCDLSLALLQAAPQGQGSQADRLDEAEHLLEQGHIEATAVGSTQGAVAQGDPLLTVPMAQGLRWATG